MTGTFTRPRQGQVIAKLETPETAKFDKAVEALYEGTEGKPLDTVVGALKLWLEGDPTVIAALKFVLHLAEKQQAQERQFGLV